MRADMAELVDQSAAADDGIVVDSHLASKLGAVGHDHVVADHTVMSHMAVSHDQTVVADNGLAFGRSAAVDGHAFANGSVVADNSDCILAAEFQILRDSGKSQPRENGAILAYTGTLHDCNIAADTSSLTDLHILVDGHKRVNHYARSYLSSRMHVCNGCFIFVNSIIYTLIILRVICF